MLPGRQKLVQGCGQMVPGGPQAKNIHARRYSTKSDLSPSMLRQRRKSCPSYTQTQSVSARSPLGSMSVFPPRAVFSVPPAQPSEDPGLVNGVIISLQGKGHGAEHAPARCCASTAGGCGVKDRVN